MKVKVTINAKKCKNGDLFIEVGCQNGYLTVDEAKELSEKLERAIKSRPNEYRFCVYNESGCRVDGPSPIKRFWTDEYYHYVALQDGCGPHADRGWVIYEDREGGKHAYTIRPE